MQKINGCTEHEFWEYRRILAQFDIPLGEVVKVKVVKNGRINNTLVIDVSSEDGVRSYTLQKINVSVFKKPIELMENVARVTEHIQNKSLVALHVEKVKHPVISSYIYYDEKTEFYWRLYEYLEANVKNTVQDAYDMFMLGKAIGEFSIGLNDFDAVTLYETIPNFHNTKERYNHFLTTIENDKNSLGECRADSCRKEIATIIQRGEKASLIVDALENKKIPYRVSHNDTKLNNVLFDKTTNEPMCLIDLDTVMPGTVLYDFGDAARYGCNTESEEATSTQNVKFNLKYFTSLVKGFFYSINGKITEEEIRLLVDAVWMITYEQAIRFLDDHIDGNHYFGVEYDGKNLERARVQLALLKDIEFKRSDMMFTVDFFSAESVI